MNQSIPGPGEMYADQEGNLFQVLCVANFFDTGEKMVVYQALYGAFENLVRPIGIFMRKMEPRQPFQELPKQPPAAEQKQPNINAEKPQRERGSFPLEKEEEEYPQSKEEQADPALLAFLDADTMEEKYNVIKSLQHDITDRLIDDFAVTLDLVIPDGRLDDRYQQLLSSVRTMQKFETTRFRR